MTLIDEQDKSLGVVKLGEALRLAQERGYDLVEVAPNAKPPVCKILDYGAYQYRLEKQERKSKAHQKRIEIKGVRLSFKIGEHDRTVRRDLARRFLDQGHKVKIEMILRGREFAHQSRARENVMTFIAELGDDVEVEQSLSKQGNKLFCLIGKGKHAT
ncbi:MAG: translation initiation factor IF-3 [Candidatus Kerfeldbacteria bacterium]|nr:translation initiation factor IF-3 [Candidatus Kerfeldbacteria bacterium]